MKTDIKKGNYVIYANHPYEVADISNPVIFGIYDEPPSKHVDYVRRDSIWIATDDDIHDEEDKTAYLTT